MKPLRPDEFGKPVEIELTKLQALESFLTRAQKIEKELRLFFDDLTYCENRWPGQFTGQELQAFSEWKIAESKVKSLRLERDREATK